MNPFAERCAEKALGDYNKNISHSFATYESIVDAITTVLEEVKKGMLKCLCSGGVCGCCQTRNHWWKENFEEKEVAWCEHISFKNSLWFYENSKHKIGGIELSPEWRFCPSCGAKRPEGKESECPTYGHACNKVHTPVSVWDGKTLKPVSDGLDEILEKHLPKNRSTISSNWREELKKDLMEWNEYKHNR